MSQENVELSDQLKSVFKRAINWNKYEWKASIQVQNQCLDYLIDSSFQGVNRLFILLFENNLQWTSYKQDFLPTAEIKDYDVMNDRKYVFDQPAKNDGKTYGIVRKVLTCQGDDYATGCLMHYVYLKHYKMIAIDVSKQQALDADPKAMQQMEI